MRLLLLFLTSAFIGVGVTACGDGHDPGSSPQALSDVAGAGLAGARSSASATSPGGYLKGDEDSDGDAYSYDDDHTIRAYGHRASTIDKLAIAALVKRYYAVAAAGDGAEGCSLLLPRLKKEANLGEVAEVTYPPALSIPPLHGKSCARIMSLLFKEDHKRLTVESTTQQITAVRVKRDRGLALLGFPTMPERYLPVQRDGGAWKIDALLDDEIV